jgi:beta-galactosidase/beta-glucuronidase
MHRNLFVLVALLAAAPNGPAADLPRERANFDAAWRFHLGDLSGAQAPAFDDRAWRALRLPHDWSIEGPYSAANAAGTGFLPGGIGWYRKSFRLPEAARGQRYAIDFDGVYRDSDVWINGHHLAHRPYGYSSFEYDLTPFVRFGERANVLAVRVDHQEAADSRWYTGSGIYRHVWLVRTGSIHVAHWGTYVYTPAVAPAAALVTVETRAANELPRDSAIRLALSIEDSAGHEVASAADEQRIAGGASAAFVTQTTVPHPSLWSTAAPTLYTAVVRLYADGALADEYRTPFGIRTIRFDPDRGFFLNGRSEKLRGVCLHHDLGALGAAFSAAALERRLRTLQSIGVNAIRCSHNPMAPELYDLCDRLGLLVMDEGFDEWTAGKRKWIEGWNRGTPGFDGYHEDFAAWPLRDLQDMLLRDRNHPSIVLWSIGNEIDYPGDPFGHPLGRNGLKPGMRDANLLPAVARRLVSAVKALDGTRPVTQALADIQASNATGLANLLDVTGYNYLEDHYAGDHVTYPDRVILGSENSHSLAAWQAVAANAYVAGQFLWTGVDYLGESHAWPDRGSAAGLLDFCGFRKPLSYLREAMWGDRPMVYAAASEARAGGRPRPAEHWNWEHDGRPAIPVEVYTNCVAAELFLNGRSLGAQAVADPLQPVLRWNVPNRPGTVRVVGRRDGREAAVFELRTAGAPHRLELIPDRTDLAADGASIAQIEIRVVDAAGRRVFGAALPVAVEVSGAGTLAAVDSGSLTDVSPVGAGRRNAYEGRVLAIVRAGTAAGPVSVRATAPGVAAGEVRLTVR